MHFCYNYYLYIYYSHNETTKYSSTPLRYGKCLPYNTSGTHGTQCDELYTEGETYVFLSSRRLGGKLDRYLALLQDTKLFFDLIPPECINEARKVLCHYYFPTCGNSTVFEPPTSVCEDVCEHLRNLCPDLFEKLALYFAYNTAVLAPNGLTMINCFITGDYLSPLQHCCSDLDIEIREFWIHPPSFTMMYYTLPACMTLNDAGDLVPDPKCV